MIMIMHIFEYTEIISYINLCKKHFKSQKLTQIKILQIVPIFAKFVTHEKKWIYGISIGKSLY